MTWKGIMMKSLACSRPRAVKNGDWAHHRPEKLKVRLKKEMKKRNASVLHRLAVNR